MSTHPDIHKFDCALISQVGGFKEAARICGVHFTTVYRWTYPRERGGTGGIPLVYRWTLEAYRDASSRRAA